MERSSWHDAHAEAALLASRGASCRFECMVVLRKHRTRIIKKNAPGLGQFNAARLAAKELDIEFQLDRLDPLAERRLLHAKPLSGPRDVSFLRDGDELPEMPKLHSHIQYHMNCTLFIL
jgi:hypothetical protein